MKKKRVRTAAEIAARKRRIGTAAALAFPVVFAAGTSLIAVLCFRWGFALESLGVKIAHFAVGVLSAVFACLAWILFVAALNSSRHNAFLYDRKTKTEIPLEELTWERVEGRLVGYFAYYFRSRRLLATMPDVIRPLFLPCYLLQFKEAQDADVDRLLKNKEMIDSAVLALDKLGLGDDGRQLLYHFGAYEGDPVPFRAFITAAEPRFREKITDYVKAHIDEFV